MKDMRHQAQELSHRRGFIALVLTLTAVLGVSGFLAASSVAGNTRTNSTVSLGKTKLGMILLNSRGHTLYLFAKDRNGKSACSGSCARFWPPLLSSGKPTAGAGVKPSLLGKTRRSDGRLQVKGRGQPRLRREMVGRFRERNEGRQACDHHDKHNNHDDDRLRLPTLSLGRWFPDALAAPARAASASSTGSGRERA